MPCSDLFLTQLVENGCPAGTFVTDYLMACAHLQLVNQLSGKTSLRKGPERGCGVNPHHLPVSRHGIFAIAGLIHFPIISQRALTGRDAGKGTQIGDSQPHQIGDLKRLHTGRNMAQRVCTGIAKLFRICHRPDSQGIHYNRNDAFILWHVALPFSWPQIPDGSCQGGLPPE